MLSPKELDRALKKAMEGMEPIGGCTKQYWNTVYACDVYDLLEAIRKTMKSKKADATEVEKCIAQLDENLKKGRSYV